MCLSSYLSVFLKKIYLILYLISKKTVVYKEKNEKNRTDQTESSTCITGSGLLF